MANLRYMVTNKLADVSLGASPAMVTTLPQANLLDARRAYVARTTSTAAQAITGDFAANTTLDCLLLWAHNLTDAATWRLRLYSAVAQGGTLLLDVSAATLHSAGLFDDWPANRRFGIKYFAQQTTVRSFQLDLTDSANPNGYMQLGELWLGEYTELGFNFEWGAQIEHTDGSTYARTAGGGGYRDNVATVPWRVAKLALNHLADSEADQLDDISRNNRRFWADLYPGNANAKRARNGAMVVQSRKGIQVSRLKTLRGQATLTLEED